MTPIPSCDAMTVKFPREDTKREPVPWPRCWRIHPIDVARFAAEGKHCNTRKCREPIAMATWRWWRSTAAGRVLLAEHMTCVDHGRAFAERHGIDIDPEPDRPSHHSRAAAGEDQ